MTYQSVQKKLQILASIFHEQRTHDDKNIVMLNAGENAHTKCFLDSVISEDPERVKRN